MEKTRKEKIIQSLLVASALALPLILGVSIFCWVVIAFIRIANGVQRKSLMNNFKQNKILWLLPLLYLFYLVGLLWTSNFKYAGLDLQIKMTFLLLPLLIGTIRYSTEDIERILNGFLLGCTVACVYLLCLASVLYWETNSLLTFFYASFTSPLMHPTYFGMYINFAILIVVARLFTKQERGSFVFYGFLLMFYFIIALLIEARTAQAATLLTVLTIIGYIIYKKSYSKQSLILLAGIFILSGAANNYLNRINNRYALVGQALEKKVETSVKKQYDSTTGRLEIWKFTGKLIRNNFLIGTGTGDVRDELVKLYYAHDFEYGYAKKLNAHNQFLQLWATLGLFGFLLFLAILLIPMLKFYSYSSLLFPLFLIIIVLNSLTESILEVQRGVLFFSFFYSLLGVWSLRSGKTSSEEGT